MKPINAKAQKVLETIIASMNEDGYAKINNAPDAFMAVSAEKVGSVDLGEMVSVAHYYEQNGDLMRDPEMVFVKMQDGRYYPVSFQQDGIRNGYRESVLFEEGRCKGFRPRMQADQAVFAGAWMNNIKHQQRI